MTKGILQDKVKSETWDHLIVEGITNTVTGLSQMLGHEIKIESIKTGQVPVKNIPDIFGGPEVPAVGIYLAFSGATNGHFMIVHQASIAYTILDMIRVNNPGISKILTELEQSILGEIGNIMGISFLNTIRDTFVIPLHLSTPVVLFDRASALLDIALTEILQDDGNVFIVESMLNINKKTIQGIFSIMLDSSFVQMAMKPLAKI